MSESVRTRLDTGRPAQTRAVRRGATRCLRQSGFVVAHEFTLASGRRADILALGPDNDLWIVEVKSGLEDFRADLKWPEYDDWCDALVFAVSTDFPLDRIPPQVGLIVADAFGGELLRTPDRRPLAPARRRAVTLGFARLASQRLMAIEDPEFEG